LPGGRRRALLATALGGLVVAVPAWGASGAAAPAPHSVGSPVVSASPTPAFNGDAPDPDVVRVGSTYYAFTTGTALGNHIQALIDTSGSPASGWGSYTGLPYGSTALPAVPAWETVNTQTSPGVFFYDGRWVMYYDATTAPYAAGTGHNCLSVATAASLTPTPVFTDTSGGPLECQASLGGSIDPSPFIDPATGTAYLVWKSNDGGSAQAARIWSAPLSQNGLSLAAAPTELLYNDTVDDPWESTVENPQLSLVNGSYALLFSGGLYNSSSYSQALAVCSGPLGPCSQPSGPFLTSYGSVAGPGGGSLFQDAAGSWWLGYAAWSAGCTSYACGGARRLFVAPVSFPATGGLNRSAVGMAATSDGGGYWLVAADGGIFSYGDANFYGSTGGMALNRPVVAMATSSTTGGYWLVASDGGIFAFHASFFGSEGATPLNAPVVGMAATSDGGGYWEVASDGGIFTFGDARFYGSMGGRQLNAPIVGMAATPDGGGYWEVASDGGIFTFGDAHFAGSEGAKPLNAPVVGMAADPSGGYWLVAADGGIFAFGGAGFYGSAGGMVLNRPVVGMASAHTGGGYWLVAADGGIFSYQAPFYGSPA